MKNLIFLLIGFFGFCQPIKIDTVGLPPEIKQVAAEIKKEAEKAPTIEKETQKEVSKMKRLLIKVEKMISNSVISTDLKISPQTKIIYVTKEITAIKTDDPLIYWEEVPRKWTGRLFSDNKTKVRIFKYENGKKIYLD